MTVVSLRFRLASTLAVSLACAPAGAAAQTLKDALKQDVKEGLEREKEKQNRPPKGEGDQEPATKPPEKKPEKKPESQGAAGERPAKASAGEKPDGAEAPEGTTLFSFSTDDEPDEEPEPEAREDKPKKKLPVRVFGKNFKLDVKLGAGVRGWFPQQYEAVDVEVAHYYTFTVDVKAKIFKFLNIRRGYYESNSISGPQTEEAAVAAQVGSYVPKAVWLLGVLGIPITKAWEPVIRYESRAFETRAARRSGVDTEVCVIPRDADLDATGCPGDVLATADDELKIISGFETFVAGVRYDHSKNVGAVVDNAAKKAKIPPFMVGVGLMSYRKPYQLVFGDEVLSDEFLFDARFRGAGLAGGVELGGGLDRFYSDIDVQFGLGEVSLTDDLTLRELLDETCAGSGAEGICVENEFLVGYVQGTATLGYRLPLIRDAPTLILEPTIKAGGATFFLVDTVVEEGEEATSPGVNWDFLWNASVSLLIPL
ncbi:MAG: hypothetical protein PVI30_03395 [Myxococcales bacterium]|jgi:hypothetical protein